jgi:hypothetical protein
MTRRRDVEEADQIRKTEHTTASSVDFGSSEDQDSSPSSSKEEEPLFQFMAGIRQDLTTRLPYYRDDWNRPRSIYTVMNATIFAFVIQLIPALIFAELMDRNTQGDIATAETLMSSAIIGRYSSHAHVSKPSMGFINGPLHLLVTALITSLVRPYSFSFVQVLSTRSLRVSPLSFWESLVPSRF